jgi:carbamoyl-phosphate synthase small subunit
VTHVNLNDGSIEGLRHKDKPIFAVQYHPEAAPGPHDARPLFDEFLETVRSHASESGPNS